MEPKKWLDKTPRTIGDWLFLVFLCAVAYAVVSRLDMLLLGLGVLFSKCSPFLGAVALAYVLDTLVRPIHGTLLRNRPGLRWLAIVLAYVLAGLAVFLLGALVLPQVAASMASFFTNLPGYVTRGQQMLLGAQQKYDLDLAPFIAALNDYQKLLNTAYDMLSGLAPQVAGFLAGYLGNAASFALQVFTVVAGSVYMLADKARLLGQVRSLVRAVLPVPAAESLLAFCRYANVNFAMFFFGKIVDSVIDGAILFVAMSLLAMHFAPMISVVVAFASLIPLFGIYLGALPGFITLLFVNPAEAVVFAVLVIALQQLDSRVIAPRVMGTTMVISPFWVLFAIVVGGSLFGPVGMMAGVPAIVTLYGLLRAVLAWWQDRRAARDTGPEGADDGTENETACV